MEDIRNAQGQKYTLCEFLKQAEGEIFQIESKIFGHMITGSKDYINGHLQKVYFGGCVQGVDITEYGTIIYVR